MNPLNEKANTLSRCGSFYYRTLVDDSKADAEFVSHAHSYTRLMSLGNKITTAIKGGCYYEDYYKIIKFTDRDIDWNGVKEALQRRIRGGMGAITSEVEYISSSKARELGTSAWILLKEDVPTGLIDVASVQMQTLSIAPIAMPVFLQVYIIDPEGTAIHLATSTQSVTLAAGEFAEWSFAEALMGTDIYNQNSQIAFQFTTNANATWQDDTYVPTHLAVGAGSYVPAVQFYKLATTPALPSFNRPPQLTIKDHFFMGNDNWNWLSKEGTPQPIAFPGGERGIELPETQELIWDLHIDDHIMVTSIKMDDGTMLYANQDFASQFGKLTFLKNPIALFPKMQFMAQSYTGRMPNLYNYLVRADEVYGSVGKMMSYMRGAQSIKSLYHASAQAAGLAVIEKDCTVVAVSPLLEGKLYITTAGRYEANYPHTPLKPGTKLPKDYIIGGNQLYRLIGPYDPMPSNVTGINLGSALPVPGLIAPNKEIAITDEDGNYRPDYIGDASALQAYYDYIDVQQKQIQEPNKMENGMQHFRYTACPNRCVVACINESYMTAQMKLRLMTYLQRELPIGSVLVTANLSNIVNEFQSSIDGIEFVLEELRAGLNQLVGAGNYEVDSYDGKLVVHTDKLTETEVQTVTALIERIVPKNTVVERYNHSIEISWRDLNKYAKCKTKNDLLAVNPDYMNDLTSDGEWIYPLSEFENSWQIFTSASKVKRLYLYAPKMTNSGELCELNGVEYVELDIPQCTNLRWAIWRCSKVTEIRVNAPNLTIAHMFAESCGKLRVFQGNLTKLSDAGNMFYGCQLDAQSAIGVLNNLPAYTSGTHTICMGIHVDYENDPDVLVALDNATAKGWTVTRQWNGTPTSTTSTFGFKRIWVRKVEAEQGEYVAQDGTRWRVEWCNMLSAPDGSTPEDHGYELYRNVDAAVAYWGLQLWSDPIANE